MPSRARSATGALPLTILNSLHLKTARGLLNSAYLQWSTLSAWAVDHRSLSDERERGRAPPEGPGAAAGGRAPSGLGRLQRPPEEARAPYLAVYRPHSLVPVQ